MAETAITTTGAATTTVIPAEIGYLSSSFSSCYGNARTMVNAEAAGCLADCFSTGRPQSAHRQKTAHRRGFSGTGKAPLLYFIPFRAIYWKSLQPIDPVLIMFYRLALACLLVFTADIFVFDWKAMWEPLKKKGAARTYFSAGLVISMNWGIYIYMVNSEYVIQTSIGYYIEPLILCLFGIVFF